MVDQNSPSPAKLVEMSIGHLETAIAAGVPQLYFNSFVTLLGTADLTLVLQQNNKHIAVTNMSYTVAKTLAVAIGQAIAQLEEQTGREMLTVQEVQEKTSATYVERQP